MANGNQGIGSFLPFPTFGGEKSGGITPVQLSPMSPNFLDRAYHEPLLLQALVLCLL